ncbi:MAG: SUMF1/EgtB/PvdO family nonheme iron enzyme, partial [Deltaproteobacteria bacterium]|nr:SUMF1/EgtB/PvdO family nonheme iron enzyme [Deltaproteobacteria bacterium]
SPTEEEGHQADEVEHKVTLTRPFFMQATETTQGQFETLMGWNPSFYGPNSVSPDCGLDCPVERVGWFDMVAYANALSAKEELRPCYVLSDVLCLDLPRRDARQPRRRHHGLYEHHAGGHRERDPRAQRCDICV